MRKETAENLRIRADLMIELREVIRRKGLTQAQAAKLFGVSQPRISNLVRGKIALFTRHAGEHAGARRQEGCVTDQAQKSGVSDEGGLMSLTA